MTSIEELNPELEGIGRYQFGWADSDSAGASARRGLNEEVVRDISSKKNEPQWMLDLRLKGLKLFDRKPMPTWGGEGAPVDRAQALATALTAEGYAATASAISSGGQLCQHHCPVAHVAEQFPQLCEAETEVFATLLGRHVQRLATIAHGDGVCTTCIPAARETSHQSPSQAHERLTS